MTTVSHRQFFRTRTVSRVTGLHYSYLTLVLGLGFGVVQLLLNWALPFSLAFFPMVGVLVGSIICSAAVLRQDGAIDTRHPWALLGLWHFWFWGLGTLTVVSQADFLSLLTNGPLVDVGRPLVMVTIGFTCILCGFVAVPNRIEKRLVMKPCPWNNKRVFSICLLAYSAGFAGRAYDYVTRLNLPFAELIASPPSNNFIALLSRLPTFALLVAWIGACDPQNDRKLKRLALTLVVLELGFAVISGFMKSNFLVPLVIPILTIWLMKKTIPVRWLVASGLILVLVAYPLCSRVREVYPNGNLNRAPAVIESIRQLAVEGWFSQNSPSESIEQAMSRASGVGPLLWVLGLEKEGSLNLEGEFYYRAFYALIPRFLWADKPIIAEGVYFSAYLRGNNNLKELQLGDESSSTAMTLFGSFYWNFGWPGLILTSIFLGAWSAWFYRWVHLAINTSGGCLIYLACLPTFSTCENETVTLLSSFVYSFVMAWCINLVLRLKAR